MHRNRDDRLNELEDAGTVTVSSRYGGSSFTDIWDSTNIEIRDQSALQEDNSSSTASLLLKCKRQVIYPYLYILCLVAWRPFGSRSMAYRQRCSFWKVVNIFYTFLFFCLIIFTYASHLISCNLGLDVNNNTFSLDLNRINKNLMVQSGVTSQTIGKNISSSVFPSVTNVFTQATSESGDWKPAAFKKCKHLLTEYVMPHLLHFMAVLTGFYLFRIQDNEDLSALVEKVFLLSSIPRKIVSRLRIFFLSLVMLAIADSAVEMLFLGVSNLASVTGFSLHSSGQWIAVSLIVLGFFVEAFVSIVTLMSYCAQCELLTFYLREICQRMEEKTKDLSALMKDVMDVKKNLNNMNGKISIIASLIVLCYLKITVAEVINMMTCIRNDKQSAITFLYRLLAPNLSFSFIMIPFIVAARFSAVAQKFKQQSLNVRVFGYPSATQLDQDSFILFTQGVEMKAKLMLMPIHGSYVSATVILIMFGLLVLIQSHIIPTNTRYL
ncbi:uncharacterized protein LOC113686239 [Pocillopora damicornis]|uniref:uncharacterized protein LOC113686239 n=1 Tax=Pocillopora damicornis TaxID=46731 RepID=UPI000F54D075|nr:uncharacterized protein LOC113686239 [Pocillopora damicornis]